MGPVTIKQEEPPESDGDTVIKFVRRRMLQPAQGMRGRNAELHHVATSALTTVGVLAAQSNRHLRLLRAQLRQLREQRAITPAEEATLHARLTGLQGPEAFEEACVQVERLASRQNVRTAPTPSMVVSARHGGCWMPGAPHAQASSKDSAPCRRAWRAASSAG